MTNTLETKRQAVATHKRELADAGTSLSRAQRMADASAVQVRGLEHKSRELESTQAAKLAELIAAGGPSAELPDVDANLATLAAGLAPARSDFSIKTKAVVHLAEAHASAAVRLAEAERALIAHVDQMLHDEDFEEVRQVAKHLDEAVRLGMPVLVRAIAGEINNRTPPLPEVKEILDRLEQPLIDRHNIAGNFLRGEGDTAALARRAARRAALIAGEEPTPHEVAA
jgi:hypothetical protein